MTKKKRIWIVLTMILAVPIVVAVVLTIVFIDRENTPNGSDSELSGNEQGSGSQGGGTQSGSGSGSQGGGTQSGSESSGQGGGSQSGSGSGSQGGGTQSGSESSGQGSGSQSGSESSGQGGGSQSGNQGSGTQKPDEEDQKPGTYTEGLCFTEIYGEDGKTVVGYSVGAGEAADEEEIVIPSKYRNLPVVSISRSADDEAFWNKFDEERKGATEEEYLNLVHRFSFNECTKLKKITIPNSVTTIGKNAFQGCCVLKSITIPAGVTSIGEDAFESCSVLMSITIPDSVTSIGSEAFGGTAYYQIPSNWTGDVLYIDNHLIEAGEVISGSYSIRGGTKTIADNAFYYRGELTSVTIPNSVVSIGEQAFSGCSRLKSVQIGNSVTSINKQAFYNCSSLNSVTIPGSVSLIGDYAFRGCRRLEEVHFEKPNGWEVSLNRDMSGAEAVSGLDNPATAAQYLTDTYGWHYWKREG